MTAHPLFPSPLTFGPRRAAALGRAFVGGALALLSHAAFAATASSGVTIRQVGDPAVANTRNFAGVGSDRLSAASGEYTRSPITTTGFASAGSGKISTFASAFSNGLATAGHPTSVSTTAAASLTDSFTVNASGDAPIQMVFALHASGDVSASNTDPNASLGFGGAGATASWLISLTGPEGTQAVSGSVSEEKTLVSRNPFLISIVHSETGLGFSEFAMIVGVTPGAAGTSFNLSMSSEARAGVQQGNGAMSAVADFGSTLQWMGLKSVTLQDGSPYLGSLAITSESGFDYGRAVSAVPEPASYALMLAGAGLVALASRRRQAARG